MDFLFPKYIITCKDVSQHKNGSVTFHSVFEILNVEDVQEEIDFYIVLGLEYSLQEEEDRSVKLTVTGSEDDTEAIEGFTLDIEPTDGSSVFAMNTIHIQGFIPTEEGIVSIFVEHKNKTITRQDVLVKEG
ncbi:hypothetical protein [Halobacillus seohaensis]|uniref:Uncharacterized protein n=1 Tax=Halobacillus seohaensis TaxID=447421 RepID=A0ABW2EEP3_9BACI